jgi:lipopolysaccharide/colanic/teichoic acid biosynthesis glycosyltransferase
MKRLTDIFIIFLGLPLLIPSYILIAMLIKIKLGSPIIFKQTRPGLNGEVFNLIKFRTMTNKTDEFGNPLSDSKRLMKFGKFLRSTSLDELPELWNVLNGSMSIVGPRPLLEEYMPLYSQDQARRHNVRPGITGWAQINGRNSISWEDKFDYDQWYVDNQSFLLDIKIILLTIVKVIKRDGISSQGEATMSKFTGTKK